MSEPDSAASDRSGPEAEPERLRLGGMALENGLLVYGPTHWAAAVRNEGRRDRRRARARRRGCTGRRLGARRARRGPAGRVDGRRADGARQPAAGAPAVREAFRAGRRRDDHGDRTRCCAAATASTASRPKLAISVIGLAPAIISLRGGNDRGLPRRRAQGDRRLRAGRRPDRPGRGRGRRQRARALRLAPDGADDDRQRHRRGDHAPRARAPRPGRADRRGAGRRRGLGRDVRLRRASPRQHLHQGLPQAGLRAAEGRRHARAERRADRGRPRRDRPAAGSRRRDQ